MCERTLVRTAASNPYPCPRKRTDSRRVATGSRSDQRCQLGLQPPRPGMFAMIEQKSAIKSSTRRMRRVRNTEIPPAKGLEIGRTARSGTTDTRTPTTRCSRSARPQLHRLRNRHALGVVRSGRPSPRRRGRRWILASCAAARTVKEVPPTVGRSYHYTRMIVICWTAGPTFCQPVRTPSPGVTIGEVSIEDLFGIHVSHGSYCHLSYQIDRYVSERMNTTLPNRTGGRFEPAGELAQYRLSDGQHEVRPFLHVVPTERYGEPPWPDSAFILSSYQNSIVYIVLLCL